MSTTITPRPGIFPEGTAVGLHLRRNVEEQRQQGYAPLGAPVTSGVISSGAFTTSASLAADTDYVLVGFVDEVQKVIVKAKKGKFKLKFDGQETAGIKYNATAAEVREALEALSNIGPSEVEVTGGPGSESGSTPYLVKFLGTLAGTDVAAMTAVTSELEESPKEVTIETVTQGSKAGEGGVQQTCLYRTPPE